MIQHLNGEIFCESDIGMGAKFTFYIEVKCHKDDIGFSDQDQ